MACMTSSGHLLHQQVRPYLLVVDLVCVLLYFWNIRSELRSEHGRLEHYMNSGFSSSRASAHFHSPGPIKSLPSGKALALPWIQKDFRAEPESESEARIREARRKEVRALFAKNWRSYREYAWKKDVLQLISATSKDQWAGWLAILVDSLDTLWLMGMKKEFDEAVAVVAEIDFGVSSEARVNLFETTIRYFGGLLAAYDLSWRKVLLLKATELGDLLYSGFNTENRMPVDFIDFERAKTGEGLSVEYFVVSASPGTLSMEMTRLLQVTGNPKYYDAATRVMEYEIMAKHSLDTGDNLLFRLMLLGEDDVLIAGNVDVIAGKTILDPESEHLACFAGGMYAMAGRLFHQPRYLDTGAKLTRGCAYIYRSMPSGMGLECAWNKTIFTEQSRRPEWKASLPLGFTTAKDPRYILRPEAIESVFMMYRITGQQEYQDTAWDMFQAISRGTSTTYANAAVVDVTQSTNSLSQQDYMEVRKL
ncbi:seven-hairpin glycosidase [Thozetella sp. PMI_491]|nr:seven-hairpin glycosidase [Thozetella sp. PMI_491]